MMGESDERMGFPGDAVDLGGGVDLIDAVGVDQGAGGDLAGSGLFAGAWRRRR